MNFIHFLGTDKRFSFICHFSHIKYCVAHSAQRGIDALSCDIRYFLETQVVVISHLHNISLCFWQTFVYNIDLFFYLSVHHVILYVFVVVVCRHNRRKLLWTRAFYIPIFAFSNAVNSNIMCNAQCPILKLSSFNIKLLF